jgi:hypothetical protein
MRSVPRARLGLNGSIESAVMMLSRPKRVVNQGMPARMKWPPSVRLEIIARWGIGGTQQRVHQLIAGRNPGVFLLKPGDLHGEPRGHRRTRDA